MKTKLLLLLNILIVNLVYAQNTYVPDDNFEQTLIDLGYDNVLDNYVTTANINSVNNLHIPNASINSLVGIEDFTELQHLYAPNNNLVDLQMGNIETLITIDISNNNLSTLSLYVTNIQGFNTSDNPNLNCIQVNDVIATNYFSYEGNPDFSIDSQSFFSENCEDRVYVPDDNFEQALIDLGYDDVLDDYITKSDVEDVTSLDVSYKQIDILTGIKAFTSLQTLRVNNNSLDELDISDNTQLITLDISFNMITQIDISNNLLLENFLADHNKFSTVDTNANTSLIQIVLSYNNVTSLDLTSNPNLVLLNVLSNDQSFGQLSEIDLTRNTLLEDVTLQGNLLTTIDLSQNPLIEKLYIADNNLQSINFPENSAISWLGLAQNNLASLDLRPITGILSFNATENPPLQCVSVNDVTYAEQNWTDRVDEGVTFSTNCEDRVYVPDDNFEQALIDLGYDDVLDDYITKSDVENATSLDVSYKQIDALTGIEAFTSLQTLRVNNNSLDELPISENTNLTALYCGNNSLDVLDISTLTQLITLNFIFNFVDEINITNNTLLEYFNASHNNLNTLNTISNTALKELGLSYNDIENLDVTTNINLNKLDVLSNDQGFGQLTEIDLTQNTLLDEVTLQGNLLTTIDLSQNINLTKLYIAENNLSEIDLSNNPLLNTLGITQNNLSALDLRPITGILSFNATENPPLQCVSVNDVTYAEQNWIDRVDEGVTFSTNCEDRVYVPDDNFEQALIDLGYDDVLDDYITKSDVENATSLDVSYKQIDALTGIEAFTRLRVLKVNNNSLDELDITQNTMLTEVNFGNNSLDVLDVSSNTQLVTLNIIFNSIDEIDISSNTLLEYFYASHNSISTLNTTTNIALKEIGLSYNDIENLDLSTNVNLVKLDLLNNSGAFNYFTEIDLTQNTLLEDVTLQGNALTEIDLSQNINLTRLYIADNNLESIDFTNNSEITWLGLSGNDLSALDLRPLVNIISFNATENPLNCVSVNDVAFANQRWVDDVDEGVIFSSNCSDFVYVPDDIFEQRLIDLELDDVLDNFVLRADIEDVEDLNLSTRIDNPDKIQNLTGIESFTSLNSLSINFNNIANVDLSQNFALEFFFAQFCNISSLTLPNSQSLRLLDVHSNNISSLDLNNYINLTSLQIDVNNFTTLDVSQNTNLNILSISNNNIGTLDISNNIALTNLRAEFIGLSTLDISANTNLINLNVQRNDLVTIDVSTLRQLAILDCSKNNLSTLDISNNIRLETFDAVVNPNLRCIKVWDVDFANANWSDNIDAEASFGVSCYTEIPDESFEQALIDANFDNNLDGYILTSTANTIETLQLASLSIEDLSGIEDFTALVTLNIDDNILSTINLTNNTQLSSLIISNNPELDRLDISQNTNLTSLVATDNNITCVQVWDVDYANANWSKSIDDEAEFSLDCNDIWTIEIDEKTQTILDSIPGLDADGDGKITIAEAEAFTEDLDLSDKELKDVEGLQAFSNVKKLNLSGNNIDDLSPLTGGKIMLISKTTGKKREVATKSSSLETLIISNNTFETINLDELKALKEVDLSNNPNLVTMSIQNGNNINITSFDARNCSNLTCILVDDTSATYLTNFNKDEKSNFVADLVECRSVVLSTEEFLQKDVNVFPNPVTRFLTIESTKEFDYIEVYNTIGKKIIKTNERKINFSNFTSGIYLIKIIAENKVLTKKVIKN